MAACTLPWPPGLAAPAPPPPPPALLPPLFTALPGPGPPAVPTPMPAADCRARTAEPVAEPKPPSTVSEAPALLSCFCRVVTAEPRLPWRSFGCDPVEGAEEEEPVSAFQVFGPTTPSTPMRALD